MAESVGEAELAVPAAGARASQLLALHMGGPDAAAFSMQSIARSETQSRVVKRGVGCMWPTAKKREAECCREVQGLSG